MSQLARLALAALIVLALMLASGAIGVGPDHGEPIVWGDRVHHSPAELSAWLQARGRSYERWALLHSEAAARLEGRAEFPWVTLRPPPALEEAGGALAAVAGPVQTVAFALLAVLAVIAVILLVVASGYELVAGAANLWRVLVRWAPLLAADVRRMLVETARMSAAVGRRTGRSVARAAAVAAPRVRAAWLRVHGVGRQALAWPSRSAGTGGSRALGAAAAASRAAAAAASRAAAIVAVRMRAAALWLRGAARQGLRWLLGCVRAGGARAVAARGGVAAWNPWSSTARLDDVPPPRPRPAEDVSAPEAAESPTGAGPLVPVPRASVPYAPGRRAPDPVGSGRPAPAHVGQSPVTSIPEAPPLPLDELLERPAASRLLAAQREAEAASGSVVDGAVEECEITVWHGYVKSQFYAVNGSRTEGALAASPLFRRAGDVPRQEPKVLAAHEALVRRLIEEGWEPQGRGESWYAHRFRLPKEAYVDA